jgi:peptidoglycan/LPS O-acetylase OafA/YrhL
MAFGCLAFLLHQGRPVRLAKLFAWPGFTWLGRISFSVYLWQNVFCFGISNLSIGSLRLDEFPTNMAASIVCGYLSYRLFELPSLRLRRWVKQRIRSRNETDKSVSTPKPT